MPLPLIGMLGRAALMSAASGMGGAREESSSQEDTGDSKNLKGMRKNTDKMSSKGWVRKAGAWMGIGALIKQSAVASQWTGGFTAILGGYVNQLLLPFTPLVSRLLKVFAMPMAFTASLSKWFHMVFETYFHMIELTITYLWGTLLNLKGWFEGLSLEQLVENVQKVYDWSKNFISDLIDKIKNKLFGGEDSIGGAISSGMETALKLFMSPIAVVDKVVEKVGNAASNFMDLFDGDEHGSATPLKGMMLDKVQGGGIHATAGGNLSTGASGYGGGLHQNATPTTLGTSNVDAGNSKLDFGDSKQTITSGIHSHDTAKIVNNWISGSTNYGSYIFDE